MSWIDLFTSLDGRISRAMFWLGLLPFVAIELVVFGLWDDRVASAVGLLAAYPELAVLAKRGHDRNVPTWVAALCVAGGVILDLLTLADLAGTREKPSILFMVIGIPVGLFALVLLIDFGFRRGTAGPNRFGHDPLQQQRR
jgi:uncharacterized membrane protein YhaH (DUF805 family)